jgi:hypothetical protein
MLGRVFFGRICVVEEKAMVVLDPFVAVEVVVVVSCGADRLAHEEEKEN